MQSLPRTLALALLAAMVLLSVSPLSTVSADSPETRPSDIPHPQAAPETGYAYMVKPGDDVWIIAISHGIDMHALAADNGLEPPFVIQPGQKLWVAAAPADLPDRWRPLAAAPPSTGGPPPARITADTGAPSLSTAATLPPALAEWASYLVDRFNEKRSAHGLAPLTWSAQLAQAAQAHAEDCSNRGWCSHVGSDGARLRTRLDRAGYQGSWTGENWANMRDAAQAFDRWWNEPPGADPHRQNILGSAYKTVGIGIAQGGWGYYFIADLGN
ncbi:MAG: CAP domain-containing protein [Chloroflexota bacterium]|nr:CAP domain-containing protein [Chloroflexota bacterium]